MTRKSYVPISSLCTAVVVHLGTRTQILSNPDSEVKVTQVNGERLTVLKDQLCRIGTRFDEFTILKKIHSGDDASDPSAPRALARAHRTHQSRRFLTLRE